MSSFIRKLLVDVEEGIEKITQFNIN